MNLIDTIRDDIISYSGLMPQEPTDIAIALKGIVAENGADVLSDETTLRSKLEAQGFGAREVAKVLLFTKVDGLNQLVNEQATVKRADLDRFAHNAAVQSGLNRAEIVRLTGALAFATGVAYDYKEISRIDAALLDEVAFAVPSQMYSESLKSFGILLDRAIQAGIPASELDYTSIEPLAHLGLPKAKYYLGYCMINGNNDTDTRSRGFELLREAAYAGDIQACAALGDYCYELGTDMWTEAYAYYTGIGSLALNAMRREHMVNILNRKEYNFWMLCMSALLLGVMSATSILSLGAPVFGGHVLIGVLCSLVSAVVLVFGFLHHRAEPYEDAYVFPFAIFAVWTVFMVVRFVF